MKANLSIHLFGVLYNKHDEPTTSHILQDVAKPEIFFGVFGAMLGILQAKKGKGIFQNNCARLNSFNKNLTNLSVLSNSHLTEPDPTGIGVCNTSVFVICIVLFCLISI